MTTPLSPLSPYETALLDVLTTGRTELPGGITLDFRDEAPRFLYHGGVPGLRPGDRITPGHARKHHEGCPWCEARAAGGAHMGLDGPSQHADRVYLTTNRLYAAHHASLYGRGDLYRVEPTGDLVLSTEDSIETWTAPGAVVVAALDRAVLLTPTQRRRLWREWTAADLAARGAP